MDSYERILGCLLGTAIGDAAGLRREGLSRRRALRIYGDSISPQLIAGRGFCSDDTELTVMTGRALALHRRDLDQFERSLAGQLRSWILTAPAGVGLATLRASLRLVMGISPAKSGVYSAGNGPAVRAALLGVCSDSFEESRELVLRSTRITHTGPKAFEGALLISEAARFACSEEGESLHELLSAMIDRIEGQELRRSLIAAQAALRSGASPQEFCASQGWEEGVSGYVNHTVPAAIYCWAATPDDFRRSVTCAVLLGGDTDSVAAITGAIAGTRGGCRAIPTEWKAMLAEWPRTTAWLERLAEALDQSRSNGTVREPPPMHWLATLPRNALFAMVVLSLGFRRLLPPY
jgi:ADP-ribosyl-[dinitrogen reductase] hydrolase